MAENPSRNLLKRSAGVSAPTATYAKGSIDTMTAACVSELMNAATSFHKLHLKVTGTGSYAAHKALNDLYDALPGHADDLAEGFQGAAEKLLSYTEAAPKVLGSVENGIDYIRDLTEMVTDLQSKMPYSELVNDLDTIKSTLNSAKYKLLFLK
jgi:DNA-binding ferritin-like protein